MKEQGDIKSKFSRNKKTLSLKPDLGLNTAISKTRLVSGLSCETREGDWVVKTDLSAQMGGYDSASSPGVIGRAALGSCLAMGYMISASNLDVKIDSLEVQIEADCDDGGFFGTTDSPPGYLEIRYTVRIKSPASPDKIENVLNLGDKRSPYLDVFSRAHTCIRHTEIIND